MIARDLRIFARADASPRRALVHPGRPQRALAVVEAKPSPPIERSHVIDDAVLGILASAPAFGETIDAAYRRKERELAALFAALSRCDAAALHRRLVDPREDDLLATRFARLVIER